LNDPARGGIGKFFRPEEKFAAVGRICDRTRPPFPAGATRHANCMTQIVALSEEEMIVARRYGRKASAKVKRAMREKKRGTLKSGRSGRKVTSRKQAIAIGLSEARRAGAKVPRRRSRGRGR
jgi:hypothetical protein